MLYYNICIYIYIYIYIYICIYNYLNIIYINIEIYRYINLSSSRSYCLYSGSLYLCEEFIFLCIFYFIVVLQLSYCTCNLSAIKSPVFCVVF